MNVAQALSGDPDIHIAISKLTFLQGMLASLHEWSRKSKSGMIPPFGIIPPGFKKTMGEEDHRRPRMDFGLGVWTATTCRYYPMESLLKCKRPIFDELDGRCLLVYIDPISGIPIALYTNATKCTYQDNSLYLDTGEVIRGGTIYNKQGLIQEIDGPMQLFTRWYGFAYTFPGCEIY